MVLKAGAAWLALTALPRALLAGAWPEQAMAATEADQALGALFGGERPVPSEEVSLSAPMVAEDGTIVPVSVSTTLPDVKSISIIVENNPRPLAVSFGIPQGTLPEIGCRIKMAETSDVVAVVQTGSGLHSATARVKVTLGGCA